MDTKSTSARALKSAKQMRSKKLGDSTETNETELDVLQKQQNKGARSCESKGKGLMPGVPLQKKVPVSANKWQLRSELRLQQIKNKVAGTHSF